MATMSDRVIGPADHRFFLKMAVAMAAVILIGFPMQYMMGRSTFHMPVMVHVHAVVFFGWTLFYVLQNVLINRTSIALHRRLGWIGAGWAAVVVALGIYTTTAMVRRGGSPFFFQPNYFLFMNWLTVMAFGGLTAAAIVLRRRTDWHRRLMLCGMVILTGPAWGRLLPMPLMIPWAAWGVFAAVMILPAIGMVTDRRRTGHIHSAWWWGTGTIAAIQMLIGVVAFSPAGLSVYDAVVAGAAGERVDPLAFPPPPLGLAGPRPG